MPEDFDSNQMTDEEVDTGLDSFREDETPAVAETVETDENTEQPDDEVEETEEEAPETTEDGQPSETEETTEAKVLYAGKYRTTDALEAGYQNANKENTKLAMENAELKKSAQESEQTPEVKETSEPEKVAPYSDDEYNRLYYAESPAAANRYAMEAQQAIQAESNQANEVERVRGEAVEFNQGLGQARAKELLYEEAKALNDKVLMDKYGDSKFVVTEQDLVDTPHIVNQLESEYTFITNQFKPNMVKVGNGEIPGKWDKDSYKNAFILLNHNRLIEQNTIDAHEETAKAIQSGGSAAIIGNASDGKKAATIVKWPDNPSEDESRKISGGMKTADINAALEEM